MNVLVAEDNAINVLVLTKFLKKWDVNYQVARDGNEAYHLWSQHTFDVILMDLHMPNKDGKETTQLIRASTNEFINKIPIIALTADTSVKTRDDLLSNGFNHYLTKPFDPNTLFGLLKEYSLIA